MLLTLALVVLGCAIVVFFSQEFGKLAKKILAYPGAKLILPITMASALVAAFEPWVLIVLLKIKAGLHYLAACIEAILPFTTGATVLANFILLLALTLLPVFAINALTQRKSYLPFQYPFLVSTLIWIFVTILLVVNITIP